MKFLGALIVFVAQRAAFLIKILAAEGLGQLVDDEIDQLAHLVAQFNALPGPQIDRDWRFGRAEVINVNPITRRRHRGGFDFEHAQNRVALGARTQASHKDVVAWRVDAGGEANRIESAFLAEQLAAIAAGRELQ